VETPEHRHLTRISSHALEERPEQEDEEKMEEGQHNHDIKVIYNQSFFSNKDKSFNLLTVRGPQMRPT